MNPIKNIFPAIAVTVASLNAHAETVICPKPTGSMLVLDEKYEKIDFAVNNVVIQLGKETVTIIAGDEKEECIIIKNNKDCVVCVSVLPLATTLLTYNKEDNKLYYSKHSVFTESQYHSKCKLLK